MIHPCTDHQRSEQRVFESEGVVDRQERDHGVFPER
jgi:hypothetical protein